MSEPEGGAPKPPDEPKVGSLGPGDVTPLEEPKPFGPGAPPLPANLRKREELLPAPAVVPLPAPAAAAPPPPPAEKPAPGPKRGWLAERPEVAIEVPRGRLAWQSRRAFMLFWAGVAAAAAGAWWLLPDRTRARLAPGPAFDALDSLAARAGLTRARRESALDRALTFDDDVAEALYSKDRHVRTYDRSDVTFLRNNYNGRTPGPEYLATWRLNVSGLASGKTESLSIENLLGRFKQHGQVTRLVCVEGWSAVAWWSGIRFADFLEAFPPARVTRWAALRSAVNLDGAGRPDPYYVSIDLETARHPQTLLATHFSGQPLPLEHGAPLRLLVPMKLGLKNIKAVTDIAYTAAEPADYWNERGYSKYDGL
jgi:DMSO/TMAO reductase YedYZ molybdopterin-dependent catalytic subunit